MGSFRAVHLRNNRSSTPTEDQAWSYLAPAIYQPRLLPVKEDLAYLIWTDNGIVSGVTGVIAHNPAKLRDLKFEANLHDVDH